MSLTTSAGLRAWRLDAIKPESFAHMFGCSLDDARTRLARANREFGDVACVRELLDNISAPALAALGVLVDAGGLLEEEVLVDETAEQFDMPAEAVRHGLVPILCVGELAGERDAGATHDVCMRQLSAGLHELTDDQVAEMAIAYEPVWAIGTGKTATPADASEVHGVIRRALAARLGARSADVPILYGGSVNGSNAAALLQAEDVDGLLVGGASLDAASWATICEA